MAVRRIVTNIAAGDIAQAKAFYGEILGMGVVMDLGWIVTFGSGASTTPQISIASEGGSGTAVPDISVEVDDFDAVLERIAAKAIAIEYGPAAEPWGVRRVFLRDPFGRLVNILCHETSQP